ncbi:MAG TPA: cyanophycin synthetase, partial [Ktedonobacterales bacterium]
RRFDIIEDGDVTFVDDYAHHPHAIQLTVETARRRFPGRRVVAIFQPTLYTRLYKFLEEFADSLALADEVIAVEIQPSREYDTEKVNLIHGSALSDAVMRRESFVARGGAAQYGGTLAETAALIRQIRRPGDVFLVLGSGPVNRVIAPAMAMPASR